MGLDEDSDDEGPAQFPSSKSWAELEEQLIFLAKDRWRAYRAGELTDYPQHEHLWHLVRLCRFVRTNPSGKLATQHHLQLQEAMLKFQRGRVKLRIQRVPAERTA